MNGMNFAGFDLNLLRVFDAVMQERSVRGASRRIGLSQSAVSHALNRLRHALQDELFVRAGNRISPTHRAVEIASDIHDTLVRLRVLLDPPAFDPTESSRVFRIGANDFASSVLLPPLLQRLRRAAPHVSIRIYAATALDISQALDLGQIDFAISSFVEISARFGSLVLCQEEIVYVMKAGHLFGDERLTLERLAQIPHVTVSLVGVDDRRVVDGFIVERGLRRRAYLSDFDLVERLLAEQGLRLWVGATVPHVLTIPFILSRTDMIAMLPRRMAEQTVEAHGLRIYKPPFALEPISFQAVWHGRNTADPANAWMCAMLTSVVGELLQG
ncbi:MAG: LysR family transcriptional regulator [Rhodospirillales bacterium]|jgi:DNA-binding transcriptional LysR family regulator|nr:LysR family transcriptional regulator [Rhodospirillales bacterium]